MQDWLPIIINILVMVVAGTVFVTTIKGSVDRLSDSVNHLRETIEEIKAKGEARDGEVKLLDKRLTIMEVKQNEASRVSSLHSRIEHGMQNDHDDGA